MLGAIIGDVIGSHYEILEIQEKRLGRKRSYADRMRIFDHNTPLFTDNSSVTDDSILTCAIYDAIVNGHCDYEKYLRAYGLYEVKLENDMYGRNRFGSGFVAWLNKENEGNSWANGAAMRVSPVGFLFDDLESVKENARLSAIPSHNNEEAIKSAEAVAVSIFLLCQGTSKSKVEQYVKDNYYQLNYDLDDLQHNYTFTAKASESVPPALFVFFQSNNFEDSIRKAISIGGDSDTIAAIVGSLSEAYYGIDNNLKEKVKPYLRDYMIELLKDKYLYDNKVKEKNKNERSN